MPDEHQPRGGALDLAPGQRGLLGHRALLVLRGLGLEQGVARVVLALATSARTTG
ncbi:MAG: hypothetical protein AB7N76_23985 [Planctomycetota bacterium]